MSKRSMNKEENKTRIKVCIARKTKFQVKSNQDKLLPSLCAPHFALDFTLYNTDIFFLSSLISSTIDRLRNFLIALSAGKFVSRRLMKNIPQSGLRGY